jgi:FkbM family methyltransferase
MTNKNSEIKIGRILAELTNRENFPKFIIDVGGNVNASVSMPFIKKGWGCVIVEPQKVCVEILESMFSQNSNVEVVHAACSDKPMQAKLFHGKDGPDSECSTLNTSDDSWMSNVRSQSYEEVEVVTITSIIQNSKFIEIGVLKIDTESWDYKVLMGLDFKLYRPYIIVTEEYLWNIDDTINKNILLENNGYVCLGWLDHNTIWIRADKYNVSWSHLNLAEWLKKVGRLPFPLNITQAKLTSISKVIENSRAYLGVFDDIDLGFYVRNYPSFKLGEQSHITATIINLGSKVLPSLPISGTTQQIFLSYHWASKENKDFSVWEGVRTKIPYDCLPGEAIVIGNMEIIAPSKIGIYELHFDLCLEGVEWFSSKRQFLSSKLVEITSN